MAVSAVNFVFILSVTMVTLNTAVCQLTLDVNGVEQIVSLLENINDSSAIVSSFLPHLGSLFRHQNDLQTLNNVLLENNTVTADMMATILPHIEEFMQLVLQKMQWHHDEKKDLLTELKQSQTQMAVFQFEMASAQTRTVNILTQLTSTQSQIVLTQSRMASNQSQMASTLSKMESTQSEMASNQSQMASTLSKMESTQSQMASNQSQMASTLIQMEVTQLQMASTQSQMAVTQLQMASTLSEMASTQSQMALTQNQMASTQNQLASTQSQMASTQIQILNTLNQISQSQTQMANSFSEVASLLATQNQQLQTTLDKVDMIMSGKANKNIFHPSPKVITAAMTTESPTTTHAPTTPALSIQDCSDLTQGDHPSGIYSITLSNGSLVDVYCDMDIDGGGWTVFQKRFDGSVDFYRGWDDYVRGFGSLNGEFWLGLEIVHQLTRSGSWELQVQLEDFDGDTAYANYQSFSIGDAESNYKLTHLSCRGTAGDFCQLSLQNNKPFTTKDRDFDDGNCAQGRYGAWWHCTWSNLNGYYFGVSEYRLSAMHWFYWKHSFKSLKASTMMMRRTQ